MYSCLIFIFIPNFLKELCQDLQYCHLNLEVQGLKAQIEHMLALVSLQDQYNKQTEK